ncbi:MAG: hypothetical protein METHAR1v1_1420001 [Methanothrix sp.]|nr:MAG: hypothetical protein METHAR1v1_1420001 [Methanothrix sp.]
MEVVIYKLFSHTSTRPKTYTYSYCGNIFLKIALKIPAATYPIPAIVRGLPAGPIGGWNGGVGRRPLRPAGGEEDHRRRGQDPSSADYS